MSFLLLEFQLFLDVFVGGLLEWINKLLSILQIKRFLLSTQQVQIRLTIFVLRNEFHVWNMMDSFDVSNVVDIDV